MERLRARFCATFDALGRDEVLALVTAEVEGQVSNGRLQQLTDTHPRELTLLLRGLVERAYLLPDGRTMARTYRVAGGPRPRGAHQFTLFDLPEPGCEETTNPAAVVQPADGDLGSPSPSASNSDTSSGNLDTSSGDLDTSSEPWRSAQRTRALILELCRGRFLTAVEIAAALDRRHQSLRRRHLNPLVQQGRLELRYPDRPNHKDQAYRTREGKP
ncbi:MAG: hypothetical protein ABIO70_25955 [Pseudomonadota bacterium]